MPAIWRVLCTLLTDWRLAIGDEPARHRTASHEAASQFYITMKESATSGFESSTSAPVEQYAFSSYTPADDSQRDKRIQDIVKNINVNKRKKLELYAVLGSELAQLKHRYITTMCSRCVSTNDVYAIINCISCIKNSDMKSFYEHVGRLTSYSKDYVNFVIRISRMCVMYPKVLYVSLSTTDMKKHLKYIESKIEEEKEFWSL